MCSMQINGRVNYFPRHPVTQFAAITDGAQGLQFTTLVSDWHQLAPALRGIEWCCIYLLSFHQIMDNDPIPVFVAASLKPFADLKSCQENQEVIGIREHQGFPSCHPSTMFSVRRGHACRLCTLLDGERRILTLLNKSLALSYLHSSFSAFQVLNHRFKYF